MKIRSLCTAGGGETTPTKAVIVQRAQRILRLRQFKLFSALLDFYRQFGGIWQSNAVTSTAFVRIDLSMNNGAFQRDADRLKLSLRAGALSCVTVGEESADCKTARSHNACSSCRLVVKCLRSLLSLLSSVILFHSLLAA